MNSRNQRHQQVCSTAYPAVNARGFLRTDQKLSNEGQARIERLSQSKKGLSIRWGNRQKLQQPFNIERYLLFFAII